MKDKVVRREVSQEHLTTHVFHPESAIMYLEVPYAGNCEIEYAIGIRR